jgi:hypothetical protein
MSRISRYVQRIKQKIAKNSKCPHCHKKISFGRKIWVHGYIWNDEPCPHCNQTIKVVGLGWNWVVGGVVWFAMAVFLVEQGRLYDWQIALLISSYVLSVAFLTLFYPIDLPDNSKQ